MTDVTEPAANSTMPPHGTDRISEPVDVSPGAADTPVLLELDGLTHRYGDVTAVDHLSFSVHRGELFGLLGPNGGGKTTLFRVLTTIFPVQEGNARLTPADGVSAIDLASEPDAIRRQIGITFQSPSLDDRLSVRENLMHQGHLYGLSGGTLRGRIDELLERFQITDRAADPVSSLSGGLQRRVEIAKGMLHRPRLLLLDEPTTGLDPAARRDVWTFLKELRDEQGITVLATTHIMEEAELCDRLAILDRGRLVALGRPGDLRAAVGGDCLTLQTPHPEALANGIRDRFDLDPVSLGTSLRIETPQGHELLRDVVNAFPDDIQSVSLGKPTLEDVFFTRTGRTFVATAPTEAKPKKKRRH